LPLVPASSAECRHHVTERHRAAAHERLELVDEVGLERDLASRYANLRADAIRARDDADDGGLEVTGGVGFVARASTSHEHVASEPLVDGEVSSQAALPLGWESRHSLRGGGVHDQRGMVVDEGCASEI